MLERSVLVRPMHKAGPLWFLFIGLGLVGLATYLAVSSPAPMTGLALALGGLGVALLIACGVWWKLELDRRIWIVIEPDHFVIQDRQGVREVSDEQVVSLSVRATEQRQRGAVQWLKRFYTLWIDDGVSLVEPIVFETKIKPGEVDQVAGLVNRINNKILEQTKQDWHAGKVVEGDGWALDHASLALSPQGKEPIVLDLNELVAAEAVDNHVSLWLRDRDEAAARLSLEKRHAHILLQMLAEFLKDRKNEESEPTDGRMGRIIFERRASKVTKVVLSVLAGLLFLFGLLLIVAGLAGKQGDITPVIVGTILVAVGGLCVVAGRGSARSFFRCHQWGLHQRGLLSDKRMRFSDVHSYTYTAVAQYVNGVYSGTTFTMTMDGSAEGIPCRISHGGSLDKGDEELENLREHISRLLASRMLRRFQQGEVVTWTSNLAFQPDGILYRPPGFVGRKEPQVLPYDQLAGFNIDQGSFFLFKNGEKKAVMQEPVSATNFFPGFYMLSLLTSSAEKTS